MSGTSKFRKTRYKSEDVPKFFRKTKFLKKTICNFNISNQINNGKLYDPITNEEINLNTKKIHSANAPTIIKGDPCPRIYAHETLKELIQEASKRGTFARNPYTRTIAKSMGPPPVSVINYVKKLLKH